MDFDKDPTLKEWTREQPLSVLTLDSADRAVLRIAGKMFIIIINNSKRVHQKQKKNIFTVFLFLLKICCFCSMINFHV